MKRRESAEGILDGGVRGEDAAAEEAEGVGPVWEVEGFGLGDACGEHFERGFWSRAKHNLGEEVVHAVFEVHETVLREVSGDVPGERESRGERGTL